MQVSILEGAYFDSQGNIRSSLPINMQPMLGENGFSKGFLRTTPGLTLITVGPGQDRGSILYQGIMFRVMGDQLCSVIAGVVTQLGGVGNDGKPVRFDYGFDRLAILSANGLYYWQNDALTQVTDPNLTIPIDMCWIDGYYMLTDGVWLYVTELSDPTTILPNGSEQPPEDPSPVVALMQIRDEIYVVTTNSIQNFQNVGGLNFPFQVNPSAMISKGATGTRAVTYFRDTLAFVGNGRNEAPSVYMAGFGTVTPISTPEIDRLLTALTPAEQAAIETEQVATQAEQRLYVHLPTVTLVYHYQASQAAQMPIWSRLVGSGANAPYPARHFVSIGGYFFGGSPTGQIGSLDETTSLQFGQNTSFQFDTTFLYNGGKGAILQSVELIGTAEPGQASLSWTRDGLTWTTPQTIAIGSATRTPRRMQWRPKTRMWNFMGLRFQLQGGALAGFGRLEVGAEPLNV